MSEVRHPNLILYRWKFEIQSGDVTCPVPISKRVTDSNTTSLSLNPVFFALSVIWWRAEIPFTSIC